MSWLWLRLFFAGFVLLKSGKGLSFILDFYSFLFLYLFSIPIRDVASVASTIDFSQFSSIFLNSDSRNGFGFDPDFLFSVILHWKISLVKKIIIIIIGNVKPRDATENITLFSLFPLFLLLFRLFF